MGGEQSEFRVPQGLLKAKELARLMSGLNRLRESSTRQGSVFQQNPVGSGRVPHVRLSVRGPNKTGEAHQSFCEFDQLKAIETYHFRPTYAEANVGHPSSSY